MRISFRCLTNRDYVAINTVKFILPTGSTITVDRDSTEWDIDKSTSELTMVWKHCYIWAIDGNNIFTEGAYITDGANFEDLVADSKVVFELEEDDDSDCSEDYEVDVLEWSVGE